MSRFTRLATSWILWLIPAGLLAQSDHPPATVQAELTGIDPGVEIVLHFSVEGQPQQRTTRAEADGRFTFTVEVTGPTMAVLRQQGTRTDFVLAPGSHLTVTGHATDARSLRVEGDHHNEAYQRYRVINEPLHQQIVAAAQSRAMMQHPEGSAEREAFMAEINQYRALQDEARHRFIHENPEAFVSLALLQGLVNNLSFAELDRACQALARWLREETYDGIQLGRRVETLRLTAEGQPALDFTRAGMHGEQIRLADFRGRYVILSFWGSWCGPCRRTHPEMKALHAKYHARGLEIIGISSERPADLAEAERLWRAAIAADGIEAWHQILNNQNGDAMNLVRAYGVSAFPTKILLDRDGKVLGRYIGANANLKEAVTALFDDSSGT